MDLLPCMWVDSTGTNSYQRLTLAGSYICYMLFIKYIHLCIHKDTQILRY